MASITFFATNNWIVLTRAPFAFGPFDDCNAAYQYAERNADRIGISIVVPWYEPEWVCEGCPPAFGAVWFNGNWDKPFVVGPFYDIAEAAKFDDRGMAVALDEFPEELEDDEAA